MIMIGITPNPKVDGFVKMLCVCGTYKLDTFFNTNDVEKISLYMHILNYGRLGQYRCHMAFH